MAHSHAPLGFLGFGEAGFHLALGLREAGAPPMIAFDIHADRGTAGERIRSRAAATDTRLVASAEALGNSSAVILSVVTAASALDAARSVAPSLAADRIFVDLNSVAPATKRQIADLIGIAGARFVEGAIMAPVPPAKHRVPILLNGPSAHAVHDALSRYGARLEVMNGAVGAAAAVKMCRSIVIKGLEALLLECAVAAGEYDATDRVFDSLDETFPGMKWRQTADYMIGRVLEHGERRAREMEEVAGTLRAAGIDPIMAEATARRQDWDRARSAGRLGEPRPDSNAGLLALLVDRPGLCSTPPAQHAERVSDAKSATS
jgi:3-hydroxyisobutyrate dehydrogenase-like beta-hydroxyacid dehydrogenase